MFGSDCPCHSDGIERCYGKDVLSGINMVVDDDGIRQDILHNNAMSLIND